MVQWSYQLTLKCDNDERGQSHRDKSYASFLESSMDQARDSARNEGWSFVGMFVDATSKALCPECTKAREGKS